MPTRKSAAVAKNSQNTTKNTKKVSSSKVEEPVKTKTTRKAASKPAAKSVIKATKPVSKPVSQSVAKATKPVSKPVAKAKPAAKTKAATKAKPAAKTKAPKEKVAIIQDVNEETGEVIEEPVVEKNEEPEKAPVKKQRRQPTKETILADLDELIKMINDEITVRRESTGKTNASGIKYLRTLNKRATTIKSDCSRVMKQKQRVKRTGNNNSGFNKPVYISEEMSEFTGWDPEMMRSRVDVTRYICNYIKENELQNPNDRREIIPDDTLSTLLKYDKKTAKDPLKYGNMQKYLKHHFKN